MEKINMCSKFYIVEILCEWEEWNLENLTHERGKYTQKRVVKYFREEEIWDFVVQIFRAIRASKEEGIIFDDVHPQNVLYRHKNDPFKTGKESEYQLKLLNPRFFKRKRTPYMRKLRDSRYPTYLSPELMNCLKTRSTTPTYNKEKSLIWSVGMTLLCTICNEEGDTFYDWGMNTIRYYAIEDRLKQMEQVGYSNKLCNVVEAFLCPNELNRPDIEASIKMFSDQTQFPLDLTQKHRKPNQQGVDYKLYRPTTSLNQSYVFGDKAVERNLKKKPDHSRVLESSVFSKRHFDNRTYQNSLTNQKLRAAMRHPHDQQYGHLDRERLGEDPYEFGYRPGFLPGHGHINAEDAARHGGVHGYVGNSVKMDERFYHKIRGNLGKTYAQKKREKREDELDGIYRDWNYYNHH